MSKIEMFGGDAIVHCGNVLDNLKRLKSQSVHCVVTSPPYWNMRDYSTNPIKWPDGWEGELGSEPTAAQFVEHLVHVFRKVRRVLRKDGTLWVNLGDGWNNGGYDPCIGSTLSKSSRQIERQEGRSKGINKDIPRGCQDLIPHRFALRMIEDGWILRSTIVWAKAVSGKNAGGAVMPESMDGWRWERCRVKVTETKRSHVKYSTGGKSLGERGRGRDPKDSRRGLNAKWKLCPGCPKCEPNNGWVLKKRAWRPTGSFEYIFLFVRSNSYFCDKKAVEEKATQRPSGNKKVTKGSDIGASAKNRNYTVPHGGVGQRNMRSVWWISPEPMKEKHYAAFPQKLPYYCIKAGTSEEGCCPECGAPYVRMIRRKSIKRERPNRYTKRQIGMEGIGKTVPNDFAFLDTKTVGWKASCECDAGEPEKCVVMDPFLGTGTTVGVALKLNRKGVGFELNEDYIEFARKRIRKLGRKRGLGLL